MSETSAPATREPDRYGIAVGDLVAGTCITAHASTVGVVVKRIPSPIGAHGHRYRIRTGELYPTGDPVERIIHDHPKVIVPASDRVRCTTCRGEHRSPTRFVECLIAAQRAEIELAALDLTAAKTVRDV